MAVRMFPVMFDPKDKFRMDKGDIPSFPSSVPWDFVEKHEEQAQQNHGQSLSRLAGRGGLDPLELLCLVEDKPLAWKEFHVLWKGGIERQNKMAEVIEKLKMRMKEAGHAV